MSGLQTLNSLLFHIKCLRKWPKSGPQRGRSPIWRHIAVELITGPRLGHFKVNNWATFVFFEKIVFSKTTIKIGVSADFLFKKKGGTQNLQS